MHENSSVSSIPDETETPRDRRQGRGFPQGLPAVLTHKARIPLKQGGHGGPDAPWRGLEGGLSALLWKRTNQRPGGGNVLSIAVELGLPFQTNRKFGGTGGKDPDRARGGIVI